MKIKPWMIALAGLLLVVGAYCFGRRDAPGRADAQVNSLLDGIKAYQKDNERLTKQLAEGKKQVALGLERERKLAKQRTPTPPLVPASCHPWAANLETCDRQVTELRTQVEATGRLLALAEQSNRSNGTRVDSLTKALKKARAGDYVLGIKLPSRSTSFGIGALLGGAVGLLVSHR